MKTCLTIKLLPEASGCLAEKPECGYAQQFGFSFICLHPDHRQFYAHVSGALTKDEALKRYYRLKHGRREQFVGGLNEKSRRYFCHKTDFHGQPLSALDIHETD